MILVVRSFLKVLESFNPSIKVELIGIISKHAK